MFTRRADVAAFYQELTVSSVEGIKDYLSSVGSARGDFPKDSSLVYEYGRQTVFRDGLFSETSCCPKGITSNSNNPSVYMNAVLCRLLSFIETCQYPDAASSVAKYFIPERQTPKCPIYEVVDEHL